MVKAVGIDVIGGSTKKFALVSIGDMEFSKIVSKAKLFKIINSIKPEIIAVDNVFEIFEDKNDLLSFLKFFPGSSKLIQVCGQESLHSLAKRFGLKLDVRNPFEEARAAAILASLNVGYEVSVFTNKTKIIISRGRSLGRGGWRQKKYCRRVHELVRQVYIDIKQKLIEKNLDFVEEIRKGYGGFSRAVLIVNAPKSDVPISPFRTKDVQVKVEAIEKEKIELIPLSKTLRYTIVGIDPGATTAVAVLDLKGNLIDVTSKKNWKVSEVIEHLTSLGKPVIIATDKSSPPDFVQKIKASFNAILYSPKEDINTERKKILTLKYKTFNDHERDALAAALEAFNVHKSKFINIEKRIPSGVDVDRIKAEALKGTPVAALLQSNDEFEVEEKKEKKDEFIPKSELEKREKIISELKIENEILRDEISKLKDEIEKLRQKIVFMSKEEYEKIRKDRYVCDLEKKISELSSEIRRKDDEIKRLQKIVEDLKKLRDLTLKGWKEVKVLKKFTNDEIEAAKICEGDIVYIVDSSGGSRAAAELLASKKIKAIIYGKEMSHLAVEVFDQFAVPRIKDDKLEVFVVEDFGVVKSDELEKALKTAIEEVKRKKIKEIEKLFEEYRKKNL
ncbi:MAG: DUF460 domain-containing protein [Archaeoglobaceae archaeon]|nr:DUF460 domain-containing protein [Archaeoglobaceae archaeon]MCX8152666.1 DUF460 domain-containing protein [Archaeoglobaceae archaeon]MDW8013667.1 DUF460 domain-containing protein [Archaeoglobaceae archaeon]